MDTAPHAAMPNWMNAYERTGRVRRSAKRPASALPIPSPAMNAATTVALPYSVLPKM